jgi:hypothetical protein
LESYGIRYNRDRSRVNISSRGQFGGTKYQDWSEEKDTIGISGFSVERLKIYRSGLLGIFS